MSLPTSHDLVNEYRLFAAGESHPLEMANGSYTCHCDRCERWATFVGSGGSHGQPVYLIPTADLADGLASQLISLQAEANKAPLRCLEVGAGDGMLAMHVKAALRRLGSGMKLVPTLVATDSGRRGLEAAPGAEVLRMDVAAALAEIRPDVVLCAFMPLGEDWTALFRQTASVHTYCLLGEVDDGCCGRPWATWGYLCDDDDDAAGLSVDSTSGSDDDGSGSDDAGGNAVAADDAAMEGDGAGGRGRRAQAMRESDHAADETRWRRVYSYEPARTPFGSDGWHRRELKTLSTCMLCATDVCWVATRHAKAVCFSRGSFQQTSAGDQEGRRGPSCI
jgi:hypothetical protein